MLGLIWGALTWLRSFIRSRHDLGLEIVALRQQLMVLKRQTKRAHLRRSDRLFWVLLRRAWSLWANPLLSGSRTQSFDGTGKASVCTGAFFPDAKVLAERSPETKFGLPSTPWRTGTQPRELPTYTACCLSSGPTF